jgi:hypothetical protein
MTSASKWATKWFSHPRATERSRAISRVRKKAVSFRQYSSFTRNRGLNPYVEDVARRLALANFIAYAPDGSDFCRRLSG